jgi:hypothetical protein
MLRQLGYLLIMRVAGGGGAAAGEITKVSHTFQPSRRCSAPNSSAIIDRPKDIDSAALRPGISGTATVYAPNSRPLDIIGWLLLYGRALALYL